MIQKDVRNYETFFSSPSVIAPSALFDSVSGTEINC